jgi:MFS family permease
MPAEMQPGPHKSLVAVIVFAQFAVPLMMSGTAVTLPPMADELGASGVALGLVQAIYMGTSASLVLTVGRLADATDKPAMFKLGLLVFAAVTFSIGFLPGIEEIIAARAVQGAAGSVLAATGLAIIMHIIPPEKRGRMIGLSIGSIYAGMASGPLIAGYITSHLGWRSVYILIAIPSALSCIAAYRMLESRWQRPNQEINLAASGAIFGALMLLVFGSAAVGSSWVGLLMIAGGCAFGAAFFVIESRARVPLVDIRRIRANRPMSYALITQMLLYSSAMGTTFLLSLYLQAVRHYPAHTVGLLLVLSPALMALVAPVAGRLADIRLPRTIASLGLALAAASLLPALAIDSDTGLGYVLAILALQGVGFGLFSSPNMTIIMHSVALRDTGMASALASAMRTSGMVFGMLIINVAMSWYLGDAAVAQEPQAFVDSMVVSFAVFCVFAFVALVLAFRARAAQPLPVPDHTS